jgi:hypothetical protein
MTPTSRQNDGARWLRKTCGTMVPDNTGVSMPVRSNGKQVTMNLLRVRLKANHARLTFPLATAVLRELVPDLKAPEPDWLTIAQALETAEPGGTRPPGFAWNREATLRPDEGLVHEHVAVARTFAGGYPGWLIEIPLAGNPNGLGRYQRGLVLLQTPELLRLLPRLFFDSAPALWARTWPNPQEAAIDVDRLDPCCDGLSGYLIELFRGGHQDNEPATLRTTSEPS